MWRKKVNCRKRHCLNMDFPKDLQGAKKLKWAPFAGRNLTYFFTCSHLRETYGKLYEQFLGIRFSYIFVEAKGTQWQMYRSPEESERLEAFVHEKAQDQAYVKDILERTEQGYQAYREHVQNQDRDFRNATSGQLADALKAECRVYFNMVVGVSCAIIFASALARRLQEKAPADAVAKMALPQYMTLPLEEEIKFWKLVGRLQEKKVGIISDAEKLPPALKQAIQTHFDAYCWLDCYENDPIWTMDEFVKRINDALAHDGLTKAAELEKRHRENEKLAQDTAEQYEIGKQQLEQFRLAMYYRILGESLVGLANYRSQPLFAAIAKKLLLPKNQIKWFSDVELLAALENKIEPDLLMRRLPERQKHYLVALGEKNIHVFEGSQAEAFLNTLDVEKPAVADVKEVKGVSAYPGLVQGIARVVQHVGELDKIRNGDILVTLNTTPSFILAMKRSAAIVTDEGGITCHAAIVSRELGIPCIIGTKVGTLLIPDGARIEVDAAAGTVRKLDAAKK